MIWLGFIEFAHEPLILPHGMSMGRSEVGTFYWTDATPDIVNPGREEQGSASV